MSEFIEFLIDGLKPLGPVRARKMFGGYGIFMEDVMIGLVADDTLYLKADEQSAHHFDALGLPHFDFSRKDKTIRMSYRLAPDAVFDDPDELLRWGKLGLEAAYRQHRSNA